MPGTATARPLTLAAILPAITTLARVILGRQDVHARLLGQTETTEPGLPVALARPFTPAFLAPGGRSPGGVFEPAAAA